MNGVKVCQEYKAQCAKPKPVVFLSAKSQESDIKEFYTEGDGYIRTTDKDIGPFRVGAVPEVGLKDRHCRPPVRPEEPKCELRQQRLEFVYSARQRTGFDAQ